MNYRVESTHQQYANIVSAFELHTTGQEDYVLIGCDTLQKDISLTENIRFFAIWGLTWNSAISTAVSVTSDLALFQALILQWYKERGATSSITKMAMCPSYQKIIGIGPRAIPLILRQMESEGDEPDMWFWALQVLAHNDPVTDDIRGNFKKMAASWFDWAYNIGYAW